MSWPLLVAIFVCLCLVQLPYLWGEGHLSPEDRPFLVTFVSLLFGVGFTGSVLVTHWIVRIFFSQPDHSEHKPFQSRSEK